jgi:hypothetical protein
MSFSNTSEPSSLVLPQLWGVWGSEMEQILDQKDLLHIALSSTCLNMLVSTFFRANRSLATSYSLILGVTIRTCSFTCTHRNAYIEVRPDSREDHAIGPPHSIQLPGYASSSNAGHLPYRVLEVRSAETTISASNIEVKFWGAPVKYDGKSIIIRNAVVFVFLLAALSFCAASPCVVSLSLFLRRFNVARSVPLSLPCR